MGYTAAGIDKDLVTSDQQAPLGFKLSVPTANGGIQVYTYIQSAINTLQGVALMRSNTAGGGYSSCDHADISESDLRYVGCAQQANALDPATTGTDWAIPANYYGFVLTKGVGTVKVSTESLAGDQLAIVGVVGLLDDAVATDVNGPMGCVTGTTIAAGATGEAYVNFPG